MRAALALELSQTAPEEFMNEFGISRAEFESTRHSSLEELLPGFSRYSLEAFARLRSPIAMFAYLLWIIAETAVMCYTFRFAVLGLDDWFFPVLLSIGSRFILEIANIVQIWVERTRRLKNDIDTFKEHLRQEGRLPLGLDGEDLNSYLRERVLALRQLGETSYGRPERRR
jgi:hypothetical protein